METFLTITTTKSILMNSEKHWNGLHPIVSNTQPKSTNSLYTIHPYHEYAGCLSSLTNAKIKCI